MWFSSMRGMNSAHPGAFALRVVSCVPQVPELASTRSLFFERGISKLQGWSHWLSRTVGWTRTLKAARRRYHWACL